MAVDFATAVAIFVLISVARYGAEWQVAWHRLGGNPWLAAAAFGAGWVVLVWFGGLYRVRARWSLRSEIIGLLRATAVPAAWPRSRSCSSSRCPMPAGC